MKILYATSEAVPFCKTGGLADVAGSLPPALAAEGAEIAVVLPLYRRIKERFGDQLYFECYDYVDLAWRHSYCGLFSMERDGVTWYFLDNEQYFRRPELYGYMDDGERFGFFSRAVVRMLPHLRFWPEVIHCNDWQTAWCPSICWRSATASPSSATPRACSPSTTSSTRPIRQPDFEGCVRAQRRVLQRAHAGLPRRRESDERGYLCRRLRDHRLPPPTPTSSSTPSMPTAWRGLSPTTATSCAASSTASTPRCMTPGGTRA